MHRTEEMNAYVPISSVLSHHCSWPHHGELTLFSLAGNRFVGERQHGKYSIKALQAEGDDLSSKDFVKMSASASFIPSLSAIATELMQAPLMGSLFAML